MFETGKKSFVASVLLAAQALLAFSALAGAMGLSPAEAAVENVLRGGFAEKTFTVFNTEPAAMRFEFRVEGDAAAWASALPAGEFELGPYSSQKVRVQFKPPLSEPLGERKSLMVLKATPKQSGATAGAAATGGAYAYPQGAAASLVTVLQANLLVSLTDEEKKGLSVTDFEADVVEEKMPLHLSIELENTGNVLARPQITVLLLDGRRQPASPPSTREFQVQPTGSAKIDLMPSIQGVGPGDYFVLVTVSLDGQKIYGRELPQKILREGGLGKLGQIIEIKAPPWVETGSPARVEALFRNRGVLSVNARMVGKVLLDGVEQAALESQPEAVAPGGQAVLTAFFRPRQAGRHSVRVAVDVEGQETEQVEAIVNATGGRAAGKAGDSLYYLLVAVLLGAGLAYAFRKKLPGFKLKKKWR